MTAPWWKGAVVYQVYIRSYCDSNGDGYGDFRGLISKLDYIAKLGVDAIWLSPVHPSPDRDWGYDVADYDGVHPDYGTMADFDELLAEAHKRGLKILLDEVLCHTSDEHAWFAASQQPGSDKADWYVWADPQGDGSPPNNWLAVFGGPAWAYKPTRRQYYHHKFLRQQPKLNWHTPAAKAAALKVLDDWLVRGVDGFRLDVANAYLHDDKLRDNPAIPVEERTNAIWAHVTNFQRHIHDSNLEENKAELDVIRRTVDAHADRFVFGEFSEEFERSGAYLPSDKGLHAGYTFVMLVARKLGPKFMRTHLADLAQYPDHWPCMSFSNHDVPRTVTRFSGKLEPNPPLAKLMLALLFALRGTVLMYQGEELGLPDSDLRRDQLRDPVGDLYYPVDKGRDGCRSPMPWTAEGKNFGFSSGTPWLPQNPAYRGLAASEQDGDADSTLNFARRFLAARRESEALRLGEITVLDVPDPILAFVRTHGGERVLCVLNMSDGAQVFAHDGLAAAKAMHIGCGEALVSGGQLSLGPFAAWFGRL